MAQVLSIAKIRYMQYLLQYSLNLLYPLPCVPGYKAISNSCQYKSNSCLLAMIHKNIVENGHFLIIQFLHSPSSPCLKYFLPKVKKLLFPPPSDRQVNSAGEVMEHGLSRTIQSCAMRRKAVTTHVNRKYRLYPYTVQKLLIFAHLTINYSITVLHSNL